MTLDLAKKIITSEFKKAINDGVSLHFNFHGGEIALEFELLKAICEWMWAIDWGVKFHCSAATNGTLIHDGIQKWFYDNRRRFTLALSLDGSREMHNINRSNSYDRIDLDFFVETYPKQAVKMTISPQTIATLSEGVIDIVSKGFILTANLAYGCDWDNDMLKQSYSRQLLKLSDFFLHRPEFRPPMNIMDKNLIMLGYWLHTNNRIGSLKGCGSGENMCCYDWNGKRYPCHMFMPSSKGIPYIDYTINNNIIKLSTDCKSCPVNMICSPCCGFNYNKYGDFIRRRDDMCDYFLIECLNYSYFLYEMLKTKSNYALTKELSEMEVALSKYAIAYIQKKLNSSPITKYIV